MLDLRQLHYFVAVAEEGQMTRAAARVHIAQPALSQAIGKLEAELGVKLFERHARGVRLTETGAEFFEKAAAALTSVAEAEAVARARLGSPQLTLGFSDAASDVARGVLRRFMRAHPEVEVQMRALGPAERLVELKRGRVDAELVFPPVADGALVQELVAVSPRFVLVGESHRLADASELTFEEIEQERLPGRHPDVDERVARDAWLMKYRSRPPALCEETPTSLEEIWTWIARGRGVAVLPRFMLARAEGQGVRAVPLVDVDPLEVCLAVRRGDGRNVVLDLLASAELLEA